jgi:hypothetical protein
MAATLRVNHVWEDNDGSLLSSAVEAMFGVFSEGV